MSHWKIFTAAPHRVMMFVGSLQLVLTLLYWCAELALRHFGGTSLPGMTVPPFWGHGYLMLYSLFPYFFFGFLMVTYPRWMSGPEIARSRYVASCLVMATGTTLVYVGLFTHAALLGVGALLQAVGWAIGLTDMYRVFRAASARDKTHESYLNVYLFLGGTGMVVFGLGVLWNDPHWVQGALTLGQWGFVLPVLLTVAHRMLPFFSSTVLKPYTVVQPMWVLAALPLLFAAHVASEQLGLWGWRLLFDLSLAGIGFYLTARWGLRRSFEVRLLAILHMAFAWFGIGMALYALESLLLLTDSGLSLGRAPLHALGIGLVGGMTLAMASRVTLGHSGRPLVADNLVWWCCWGLQATAIVRIAGDLPFTARLFGIPTMLWAAVLWLIVMLVWASRFAPLYLRPRIDGKPG
ncbi:MAG: NnrS family protein [Gammaproteobacteria bacterium]|nr:NnrS family protein [Gammaproteobacteria bacterium]